jgi:hypothetical protein
MAGHSYGSLLTVLECYEDETTRICDIASKFPVAIFAERAKLIEAKI